MPKQQRQLRDEQLQQALSQEIANFPVRPARRSPLPTDDGEETPAATAPPTDAAAAPEQLATLPVPLAAAQEVAQAGPIPAMPHQGASAPAPAPSALPAGQMDTPPNQLRPTSLILATAQMGSIQGRIHAWKYQRGIKVSDSEVVRLAIDSLLAAIEADEESVLLQLYEQQQHEERVYGRRVSKGFPGWYAAYLARQQSKKG